MNTSTDVKFWGVRRNTSSKTPSYEVRWVVAGRGRSRTRRTKALAESFLSDLRQAAKRGESFDVDSGLPVSMLRQQSAVTWYELVRAYVDVKWPRHPAKTREGMLDALATVTPVLVKDRKGAPDAKILRGVLLRHAFNPPRRDLALAVEDEKALRWLVGKSLPVVELAKPEVIRAALDGIAVTMAGRPAAATTVARKRAVLYNVLKYAVNERKLLDANPIDQVDWKTPEKVGQIDRSVVVNPAQARQLLAAVTYVGRYSGRGRRMMALYACMYFAGLRPAEAVSLRESNCHLPAEGWGQLTLGRSLPSVGSLYTDDGATHDDKGLKRRPKGEVRPVPIPPELVGILRAHLEEFGTAPDGRLFATSTGGVIPASTLSRVWEDARRIGLTPEQQISPLAGRPYDLRHACATLLLTSGVPPKEVARRLGHSVDVLWRVYAGCMDGDEERINRLIERALAA